MATNLNIGLPDSLSKSLSEIVSPITESIGIVSDKIRVYRSLSLARTVKRAHDIANEENLQLNQPPLKFLVPYMEDCSLENEDDKILIEMWAKLLASAASKFESEHNLFIRFLKEMTLNEANLLEYIVLPESRNADVACWNLFDSESDWDDSHVFIKIKDALKTVGGKLNKDAPFSKIERLLRNELERAGSVMTYFGVAAGEKGKYPLDDIYFNERDKFHDDFSLVSIAMLKSLGLVNEYKSPEFWFDNYCFTINSIFVTQLGAHFIKSCTQYKTSGVDQKYFL